MVITLFIFNLYALRLAQIQLLRSRTLTALAVGQRTETLVLSSGRDSPGLEISFCRCNSYK